MRRYASTVLAAIRGVKLMPSSIHNFFRDEFDRILRERNAAVSELRKLKTELADACSGAEAEAAVES